MLLSTTRNVHKLCRVFTDKLTVGRNISTFHEPLRFQITTPLCAEPLKKKKRLDPAIIKHREERKRKRIEKQIRRLEKNAQQLKPIEECEIPEEIIKTKDVHVRHEVELSKDELNQRMSLIKEWGLYRYKRNLDDAQMIDRIMISQQWALDQLKDASPNLYKAAVTPDDSLMPFEWSGPVETSPISNYDPPDGEYVDVSKKWDIAPSNLLGKPKRKF